jgi:hypothetical protein
MTKADVRNIGNGIKVELKEDIEDCLSRAGMPIDTIGEDISTAISEVEKVYEAAQACVQVRKRTSEEVFSQLRDALGRFNESNLKRYLIRATEETAKQSGIVLPKDKIDNLYNQIEISEQDEKARISIMNSGPM